MSEYLKENNHPLNQAAKKVLKNPDYSLLYCLQAAHEALMEGLVKPYRRISYQLQENLEALLFLWGPDETMEFLLDLEGDDGEQDLLSEFPENLNLEDVAVIVLEHLHSRLIAEMEGYP
jgi:hypothetical protein